MDSNHSSESGLGSSEGAEFFSSYLKSLETAVLTSQNKDDPSIDLDLAIPPLCPIERRPVRTDPSLEELEFLTNEIKKKSRYSEKLIFIMMKNLEETLGPEAYRIFLEGRLPKTWLPMIKMNDENKPYVEYLIKSNVADEDPESQLSNFTNNHLAYSAHILDHIHRAARSNSLEKSGQKRIMQSSTPLKKRHSRPLQQQQQQQKQQQQQQLEQQPKYQQRLSQQHDKSVQDLNSSLKRRQPNRSCKLNSPYADQSMTL